MKKINKIKYIFCGSSSRTGKDSLANIIKDILEEKDFYVVKRSLATPLKEECDDFLIKNFGISAFSDKTEEKNIIRDFLVLVGKMHRTHTKGTYFTDKLLQYIKSLENEPDYVIVPDLRYASYGETDELFFAKNLNSFVINIERIQENGKLVEFPNPDEAINSPKIKAAADYNLVWKTYNTEYCPEMREIAEGIVNKILS